MVEMDDGPMRGPWIGFLSDVICTADVKNSEGRVELTAGTPGIVQKVNEFLGSTWYLVRWGESHEPGYERNMTREQITLTRR